MTEGATPTRMTEGATPTRMTEGSTPVRVAGGAVPAGHREWGGTYEGNGYSELESVRLGTEKFWLNVLAVEPFSCEPGSAGNDVTIRQ